MCKFEAEYKYLFDRSKDKVIEIVKYSKIFQKGYLENMFDIESDEFYEKLIQWHEKNLALMNKNGFDISPYQI
jgi:hypothetical protein